MRYFFLVLCCSAFFACSPPQTLSVYEQTILQERFDKDISLRDPKRTSLRKQEMDKFRGLRYFPVDTSFRFIVPLEPTTSEATIKLQKRKGTEPVEYQCVGFVTLPFPSGNERLMVFQVEEMAQGTYWIPFTDATTNKESYGGGRYLDAVTDKDGKLIVDFNRAYNPLCDYNPDDYNCTLPPAQNRLQTAVKVGEQKSLLILHP